MPKNIQMKDRYGKVYPVTSGWKKLTTGMVSFAALNTTYTITLTDSWENYNEILVIIGESEYRENTPLILYPALANAGAVYCLNALSTYQFWSYVCLGATISSNADKYKVCCLPREIKGYPIASMKIIAVYGRK